MEKQQRMGESYAYYTVPKVSIDGRSHGDMLLIAICSGAAFAVIILIVLISLIRHKKKTAGCDEYTADDKIVSPSGNFTLTRSPKNSNTCASPENKSSTLMFKYFGKSLSSFDTEKSYTKTDCIAINIELDNQKQIYRKHVLTPSEILNGTLKEKYIQTIAV